MKNHLLLAEFLKEEQFPSKLAAVIEDFYSSYTTATKQEGLKKEEGEELFKELVHLVHKNVSHPYRFEIFHKSVRHPFDYFQFGIDFISPLIDFKNSKILNEHLIEVMISQLEKGENIVFLANHQTEPDPQIIYSLLENYPEFSSQLIFVAGHRVVEDPLAIPLSMGCNLLCIYSKKHIDHPPEDKTKKVSHNQRTLKKMGDLLAEGGKCIYVAPSGGRDRPDREGEFHVAPFDPQSVEMFWLMAQKSGKPTHFYPLSLLTYEIMPPPRHVEKELGERRIAHFAPVYMAIGEEIDMLNIAGTSEVEKKERRSLRAHKIWEQVNRNYKLLLNLRNSI